MPVLTGSFAEAECLECKKVYTKESIKPQIERGEVVYCTEPYCQGNDGALVGQLTLHLIAHELTSITAL